MTAKGRLPVTSVKIVFRNKEVMKIPGAMGATATGRQHSGRLGCRDYKNDSNGLPICMRHTAFHSLYAAARLIAPFGCA